MQNHELYNDPYYRSNYNGIAVLAGGGIHPLSKIEPLLGAVGYLLLVFGQRIDRTFMALSRRKSKEVTYN